jgi:hypothetical protein
MGFCNEITDPKQILGLRYNMSPQLSGNLYNLDGLATHPFRTDTLKSAKQRQVGGQRSKNRENK